MALIRWQPWQEMEALRRQFDQLFDEIAPVSRDAFPPSMGKSAWAPAIELKSTDTELVLRTELPGIEAKDLDVQVTREAVAISGEYRTEHKTEEGRLLRSEFRYGNFHRVIPLPVVVQNDAVKADFTNGVLTLTLPKVDADRPKVVKLNLTEAAPSLEASTDASATAKSEDVWTENAQ